MTNWDTAACRGHDTDDFFPVGSSGAELDKLDRARAVCSTCPIRRDCLRYALDSGKEWGVWGGSSEQERRDMLTRPDRKRPHAQGRDVELTEAHVALILDRLDAGASYPQVETEAGVRRRLCRQVWRQHRMKPATR